MKDCKSCSPTHTFVMQVEKNIQNFFWIFLRNIFNLHKASFWCPHKIPQSFLCLYVHSYIYALYNVRS